MTLTNEEKIIILGYIYEMLHIFDTVLSDDFECGENPPLDCNGITTNRAIFESMKEKLTLEWEKDCILFRV